METDLSIRKYKEFIVDNRVKVNVYLNRALWFFVITGPAIASGIKAGVFHDIKYITCVNISFIVVLLSLIHLFLLKKMPTSRITSFFALTALDCLLVYMCYSHVSIHLTWFLVPMLSVLFCEMLVFFYSLILNYILMFIATLITAPYYVAIRQDYDAIGAYFRDVFGGYTIETMIMGISAFMICKLTADYYKELFHQYTVIGDQESQMEKEIGILDSIVEIYDNVNLLNFVDNTEMSIRNTNQEMHGIDLTTQTQAIMNKQFEVHVAQDQQEAFENFTDIKTLRERLARKKIISSDFLDVENGWFRAQYITADATLDGIPNVIIFVTRNINEEKQKEEQLIQISRTDELTRLNNRRCYEEDLAEHRSKGIASNLVVFSADVNGLKKVNDTKGHIAGDELIKGAADCLSSSIGNLGRVYRTGGDEFIAIVSCDDPEGLRKEILDKTSKWHGTYSDKVTLSVGYATHKDNPKASIDELEQMADSDMYAEKKRFYLESGLDRRK